VSRRLLGGDGDEPGTPDRPWGFEDAVDPGADAAVLERIARERPDLRPLVVLNPAAPDELREWISRADRETGPVAAGPAVDAPRAERPGAAGSSTAGPAGAGEPAGATSAEDRSGEVGTARPVRRRGPRRATLRRRLRSAAVRTGLAALLVAAVFAAGAVTGWSVQAQVQSRLTSAEPRVVRVPVNSAAADEGAVMPDVRGLPVDLARQVVGDAGIPVQTVEVREQPAAGPVGTVVAQTPSFDTPAPARVSLTVSTAAVVPVVTGRSGTQVAEEMTALGARVEVERRYVPGAVAGNVASVSPAPGQPLPATVSLVVAESGGSVFLDALDAVSGSCSTGSESVDGTTYAHALTCSAGTVGSSASEVAWVLGRRADQVEATVGIPDDGQPGDRVLVQVLADGKVVGSVQAGYGAPAPLSVPVAGALRLGVRVSLLTTGSTSSYSSGRAVLGDVRLVGSQQAVDALAADS